MKNRRHMLSTGQVAKLCGFSPTSVSNWVRSGKLKAYSTPGGQYRIRRDDLLAFLRRFRMLVPPSLEESHPTRIMVIEGHEPAQQVIATALLRSDLRCQTRYFAGACQACIELASFRPDLIIVDLHLPDVDGLDVCREVKKNPKTQDARILVIAAHPDSANIERALAAGADDWIAQPLDITTLADKARRLLGTPPPSPGSPPPKPPGEPPPVPTASRESTHVTVAAGRSRKPRSGESKE